MLKISEHCKKWIETRQDAFFIAFYLSSLNNKLTRMKNSTYLGIEMAVRQALMILFILVLCAQVKMMFVVLLSIESIPQLPSYA